MPFLTISQITINSESFDSGFRVWENLNTSNGDDRLLYIAEIQTKNESTVKKIIVQ